MVSSRQAHDLAAKRATWRKVLYIRQPFEDSYVDPSLNAAVMNANVTRYKFLPLFQGGLRVAQQLATISAFASVWRRVENGAWSTSMLLLLDLLFLATGCVLWLWGCKPEQRHPLNLASCALRGICAAAMLWICSPMLRSLTRSWSDDTLAALSSFLLTIHLVLHDYTRGSGRRGLPGGAVSLNAGMFAATILASRLEAVEQVFAFVSFAMEVFAGTPSMMRFLQKQSPSTPDSANRLQDLLACFYMCSAMALLQDRASQAFLAVAFACVIFLGPALLIWAQRYKVEIQGPWDIAHVAPAAGPVKGTTSASAS